MKTICYILSVIFCLSSPIMAQIKGGGVIKDNNPPVRRAPAVTPQPNPPQGGKKIKGPAVNLSLAYGKIEEAGDISSLKTYLKKKGIKNKADSPSILGAFTRNISTLQKAATKAGQFTLEASPTMYIAHDMPATIAIGKKRDITRMEVTPIIISGNEVELRINLEVNKKVGHTVTATLHDMEGILLEWNDRWIFIQADII